MPCPPAGDLPDPGIEPASLTSPALAGGFSLPLAPPGKPHVGHVGKAGVPINLWEAREDGGSCGDGGEELNLEMLSKKKGAGTRAWEVDQLRLQEWVPWEPEVSGGRGVGECGGVGDLAAGQCHPASILIQALLGL